jgi:hypothetical protein
MNPVHTLTFYLFKIHYTRNIKITVSGMWRRVVLQLNINTSEEPSALMFKVLDGGMEVTDSFEILVHIYETTRRNFTENRNTLRVSKLIHFTSLT